MKCKAKYNSYMEDCTGGYDLEAQWITKDKVYDLVPNTNEILLDEYHGELMQFIDDAGDVHYVPKLEVKKYFKIIGDDKNA